MLDKHFKIKTAAKTKKENLIFYKNYRISLLKDRLIRVEKSSNQQFLDYPTKAILFRDFKEVKYLLKEENHGLSLKVADLTYFIADDFKDSYVLINNQKIALDNKENLLGTCEGLDGADGAINDHYANPAKPLILENGVVSKNGVAILDDSKTLYLDEQGLFKERQSELDIYIFAYGHDYSEALEAFYEISGDVPIIPRFALGNWWSRYYEYKDYEYLDLIDTFLEKDIPLTVATIDTDWHPSNNIVEYYKLDKLDRMKDEYGFDPTRAKWLWGWTGYSWDATCFKNPISFLKKLHKKGLKVTLNLHPDTICWYEKEYETIAKDLNVDYKSLKPIPLDFDNPSFINAYFNDLHKNLEHEGVDFWWIDTSNLLFDMAHYYYLDNGKEHQPLILCRYAGVGSHRYPLGFSGDSVISWKSLDFLPYFTVNATNIGYTWWSHDIGAFMSGIKDDELYLRYVQFGVFSPILRLHCQNNATLTKEPWTYKNGIGELAIKHLKLRHRMIPYLYSASYRNHLERKALMEPLYYYYPEDSKTYEFKNEYIFNGQLLVAPITTHSTSHHLTKSLVYLPEGQWTDIFTNDVYKGGKIIKMVRPLDSIPVLASEGAIFILDERKHGNSITNPKGLLVDVFNGNGTYTLYEDNELKDVSKTEFKTIQNGNIQSLIVSFKNHGAIPQNRHMKIRFRNIFNGQVTCNYKCHVRKHPCLEVDIANLDTSKNLEITVTFEKIKKLTLLKMQAKDSITYFEGKNEERVALFDKLMNVTTIREFIKTVNEAKIPLIYKQRLKECL